MTRRSRAREVALQLLFQRDHNAGIERSSVERFAAARLKHADLVAFCLALYEGVVEHAADIDQRLTQAAENWRLSRMATVDRNVLRLGAFELLHVPDTPASVVLDEAIQLAQRYGSADSGAFVNGVLDKLLQSSANQESGVRSQESGVRDQESGIRSREAMGGNEESGARFQQPQPGDQEPQIGPPDS
jgi:transcription antitermination protein NusB